MPGDVAAEVAGEVAGVVLAAGAGTRLRPLTDLRPKALCPVGTVPLLDLALDRLAAALDGAARGGGDAAELAVNAHHHADQVVEHCAARGGVHVSVERPEALGTAGALGALRGWVDGRAVLVTNADSYLPGGLGTLLADWDGRRSRLLCADLGDAVAGDFPQVRRGLRYVGAAVLPWSVVRGLEATPSGLYEVSWRAAALRGGLDLVPLAEAGAGSVAIDCGTPRDYLEANLHACAGRSCVGRGALVEGVVERSVVWDGAHVRAGERLVGAIRAGTALAPVTVHA